tara:strand:+ start:1254 stop:2120 length:867 start_codon:yes stop_codon:yes gene_type:complete
LEKRRLGKTNHYSTVISLGAYVLKYLSQNDADEAIQLCLDYGINHIDVAPKYGEAMERLAPWMPKIKEDIFLGTKTRMRSRDEALKDIELIMNRLEVDSFDLLQLHSVIDLPSLDEVSAKDGALNALIEMKDQGVAKYLGITGHGPKVANTHIEALNRFDFDTIMIPVNLRMYSYEEYKFNMEKLLSLCKEKDVGVQAIKMLARGGWGESTPDCTTWYDPYREQNEIDQAIWWQLSQKIDTSMTCGEPLLLDKVLSAGFRFKSISEEEQEVIINSAAISKPEPLLGII